MHIAQTYGERLIQKYGVIPYGAIHALVHDYPSHGFVIDYFEAAELLGNVAMASAELIRIHALSGSNRSHSRNDVTVMRLRDLVEEGGEGDDGKRPTTATVADNEGSNRVAGGDKRPEPGNRSRNQKAGKGPNGKQSAEDKPVANGEGAASV